MKCLRLLIVLVLLLQSLFSPANPIENPLSCSLPAPEWINATNISSSSITIEWADVNGAYGYRVTRFDVTHGIQLPDVDVAEPEYTSEPHDAGTTISFEVMAICENEELGAPTSAEYTTTIIVVDDIVNFTVPNPPSGDAPIGAGSDVIMGLPNADKNEPSVRVLRAKVKNTFGQNPEHFAEVLFWSHCSIEGNSAAWVMYWDESSWPPSVSYVENHQNENPFLPICSISFKMNNAPFFTIHQPTFTNGANGNPSTVGLKIHNDRNFGVENNIYFDRSYNIEHNPCFVPSMQGGGGNAPTNLIFSGQPEAQDGDESSTVFEVSTTMFSVSPNPFSAGFNAQYTLEEASPVVFTLLDQTGREIKTMILPILEAGNYSTGINTDNLPAGIYLLSFQTNQGRSLTKVVKHN